MKNFCNKMIKYVPIALLSLFMLILYIILLLKSQDNDMFFEIMSGRDILNGNFHTISHLNDFPIVVQQWLYAVCLALIDRFGTVGNILFVLAQNLILYGLSCVFIMMKTHDKKKAFIGSIAAILYCHDYMINIRPQIITVICLLAQLIFIELYRKKNSIKYLLPIFPILILSANMHQAVFLYHGLVMIPYIIQPKKPYIDWKLVTFTPLFMACSLLTPYGIDGSLYIVRTFLANTYKIININELGPIGITTYVGIKLFLLVVVTIIYLYLHKSNHFINFYVFTIAVLALINVRHISIMYIAVIFLICIIEDFHILNNTYSYSCITLLCIGLCVLFIKHNMDIRYNYGPVVNAIEDKDAPIYNTAMDLGGWLEYNGCTYIKLDSRCEAFSEEISGVPHVMEDYIILSQGYVIENNSIKSLTTDEEVLALVQDYKYVVAQRLQYVNRTLARHSDEWELIFEDDTYTVYIHNE